MTWRPPESEREWQECLSAYLDDEMEPEGRHALEEYLKEDAVRASQLEELRGLSSVLQEWRVDAPEPEPGFRHKMADALEGRAKRTRRTWLGWLPAGLRPRWQLNLVALLLCVSLGATGVLLLRGRGLLDGRPEAQGRAGVSRTKHGVLAERTERPSATPDAVPALPKSQLEKLKRATPEPSSSAPEELPAETEKTQLARRHGYPEEGESPRATGKPRATPKAPPNEEDDEVGKNEAATVIALAPQDADVDEVPEPAEEIPPGMEIPPGKGSAPRKKEEKSAETGPVAATELKEEGLDEKEAPLASRLATRRPGEQIPKAPEGPGKPAEAIALGEAKSRPPTLAGQVTDEKGTPLEGVRWWISAIEELVDGEWALVLYSGEAQRHSTGADGRFTLTFHKKARYDLQFEKAGVAPSFLFRVSSESSAPKVIMKRGLLLQGVVSRMVEGGRKPVADATVELCLPTRDFWYVTRTQTDPAGKFAFRVCPPPAPPFETFVVCKDKKCYRRAYRKPKWQLTCGGQKVEVNVQEGQPIEPVKIGIDARATPEADADRERE